MLTFFVAEMTMAGSIQLGKERIGFLKHLLTPKIPSVIAIVRKLVR